MMWRVLAVLSYLPLTMEFGNAAAAPDNTNTVGSAAPLTASALTVTPAGRVIVISMPLMVVPAGSVGGLMVLIVRTPVAPGGGSVPVGDVAVLPPPPPQPKRAMAARNTTAFNNALIFIGHPFIVILPGHDTQYPLENQHHVIQVRRAGAGRPPGSIQGGHLHRDKIVSRDVRESTDEDLQSLQRVLDIEDTVTVQVAARHEGRVDGRSAGCCRRGGKGNGGSRTGGFGEGRRSAVDQDLLYLELRIRRDREVLGGAGAHDDRRAARRNGAVGARTGGKGVLGGPAQGDQTRRSSYPCDCAGDIDQCGPAGDFRGSSKAFRGEVNGNGAGTRRTSQRSRKSRS